MTATLDMFPAAKAKDSKLSSVSNRTESSTQGERQRGQGPCEAPSEVRRESSGEKGAGENGADRKPKPAPASNELDVRICRLTLGITTHSWLCAPCRAERAEAGWTIEIVKATVAVGMLSCDDHDYRGQTTQTEKRS